MPSSTRKPRRKVADGDANQEAKRKPIVLRPNAEDAKALDALRAAFPALTQIDHVRIALADTLRSMTQDETARTQLHAMLQEYITIAHRVSPYLIWWRTAVAWVIHEDLPPDIAAEYDTVRAVRNAGTLVRSKHLDHVLVALNHEKPAWPLTRERIGLLIHRKDAPAIFTLSGFLTDIEGNFVNSLWQGDKHESTQ